MYKEVLRAISGVGIYPVVSLLMFVTVFSVALFRAARLDGARLDEYARLPLGPAEAGGPTSDAKDPGGCQ